MSYILQYRQNNRIFNLAVVFDSLTSKLFIIIKPMEKCYKVTFKAQLIKFVLAFKAESQIDIFWKKGLKIAQSQKVPLTNCVANFSEFLEISCNMLLDDSTKTFKSKMTKFEIVLYTEKGNKKVGEVHFDVAPYLNERNKKGKKYEVPLEKCPDTNSRLVFNLQASVEHQISFDAISNSSGQTVNVENLVGAQVLTQSTVNNPNTMVPTRDPPKIEKRENPATDRENDNTDKVKSLEEENRRIRQKLKAKDKLTKENEILRRKLKNQQYDSVNEIKDKIEKARAEIERLQGSIKKQVLLEKQIRTIEEDIFKCKYQIMTAFNYANEHGGGKLLNEMQEACGLKEV